MPDFIITILLPACAACMILYATGEELYEFLQQVT